MGEESAADLQDKYGGLQDLWQQRRCRQMMMLHDVCQVYPIERTNGNHWMIRSIGLGAIDALSRQDQREETDVSTALGYLAHLLVTLSGILEVPLRIIVQRAGSSRCYLSPH